jgi:ABC-type sugar transport system permease subunit
MNEVVSTRRLALAGSIGPVLFVVTVIVITVLEWDFLHRLGWHLVEDSSIVYPSATAMGPYGWLHTVNSLQVGLSIIATAIGLSRTTGARVGAGFVFLGGLGMVLSMFTTDGTSDQPTTWHGVIHDLAYLLLLFSTLLGAVVLAVQLRNQARWRRVARAAIAVPIVIIATFFLAGGLKQAGGLLSILGLLVIFGWYELLALRLLGLVTKPLSPGSVLSM